MIKALKQLKKQADARSWERHSVRDGDNRVVIEMNVRDDTQFISAFSGGCNPVVSDEVAQFLEKRASSVPPDERLTLRVYSDCIDGEEQELYRRAVGEYFSESYVSHQREYRRNAVLSLFLAVAGICMLAVMFLLERANAGAVWTAVVEIAAWVFLWEAVDLFCLENRVVGFERRRCLALMDMKIEYYPTAEEERSAENADARAAEKPFA